MQLSAISLALTRAGFAPWSPTTLFSAGEAGGAWDFTTLANLYQDSAGTSPVTTVGQTIGLVLDTKNGTPVLGPELVTNGDFSDGTTGWTLESYVTADAPSGGKVRLSGTAPNTNFNAIAFQVFDVVVGRAYRINVPQTVVAGDVTVGFYASGSVGAYIGASNGSAPSVVVATSTTLSITLYVWAGASVNVPFDVTFGPVTAKELPGNHLTQSTSTKRPLLGRMPAGGVRNLLTYTESAANWTIIGGNASSTAITGWPNGITSGIAFTGVGLSWAFPGDVGIAPPSTLLNMSFFVKMDDGLAPDCTSASPALNDFDVVIAGNSVPGPSVIVTPVGSGVYRISGSLTSGVSALGNNGIMKEAGNTARTFKASGYQLETGSTATAYQKVGAAYDVTESGMADVYTAYFDGVDDCLVSPSIDFTGTDKMSVFAGLRKLTDSGGIGCIVEHADIFSGPAFALFAPRYDSVTSSSAFASRGSVTDRYAIYDGFAVPSSRVLTGTANIAGPAVSIRQNGVLEQTTTTSQGAGNYLNSTMVIGARFGASVYFYQGFMTALSARGAATDVDTIVKMEQWLAAKTPGVALP